MNLGFESSLFLFFKFCLGWVRSKIRVRVFLAFPRVGLSQLFLNERTPHVHIIA